MKIDTLTQYTRLRQQLLTERSVIESRLRQINEAMPSDSAVPAPAAPLAVQPSAPRVYRKRGRGQSKLSLRAAITQALSQQPFSRKELVDAVKSQGYVFNTKNPLNSMGVILYAKKSPFKKKGDKFYLPGGSAALEAAASVVPEKRYVSPKARAKMAAAQRARWERYRQGK